MMTFLLVTLLSGLLTLPSDDGRRLEAHYKKAPEFKGITGWLNSEPLTLSSLHGKVVLLDFWTFSCINCIRTLPILQSWYTRYKDRGFVIVGVHSPEFAFEKDTDNVKNAIARFGLSYPIALDNGFETWEAYGNRYWPAHYLIDQAGFIRDVHFGEGAYEETENAIRALLGLSPIKATKVEAERRKLTPESYLGTARFRGDWIRLEGAWHKEPERIVSKEGGATLHLDFQATQVYLVLSAKQPSTIKVYLDGKPLPRQFWTKDMNAEGTLVVSEPRKYDVVDLKGHYARHQLKLEFPPGVSAYAFTFGDD